MHHPWPAIRALIGWTVYWTNLLPEGVDGATRWSDHTIWLRRDMSQVERRCVVEHERQHVLRGPGGVVDLEERAVDIATARALIELPDLIYAAKWATTVFELADELHVTPDVVRTRLDHLDDCELAALHTALIDPVYSA